MKVGHRVRLIGAENLPLEGAFRPRIGQNGVGYLECNILLANRVPTVPGRQPAGCGIAVL